MTDSFFSIPQVFPVSILYLKGMTDSVFRKYALLVTKRYIEFAKVNLQMGQTC